MLLWYSAFCEISWTWLSSSYLWHCCYFYVFCQTGSDVWWSLIIITPAMTGRTVRKKRRQRHHLRDDFEALTTFLAWSVNEDTASIQVSKCSLCNEKRQLLNQFVYSLLLWWNRKLVLSNVAVLLCVVEDFYEIISSICCQDLHLIYNLLKSIIPWYTVKWTLPFNLWPLTCIFPY